MHARFAVALPTCCAVAFLAARAAIAQSSLLEGDFTIAGNDLNVGCEIDADGGTFDASGFVSGIGTGGELIALMYDSPQPTAVSRSSDKVTVKQSHFATFSVAFQNQGDLGLTELEKCSVSGSLSLGKTSGAVSFSCGGDDISQLLDPDHVASLQTALAGRKGLKFKVNAKGKWSLSIACSGEEHPA
jgi:hypothetical protein